MADCIGGREIVKPRPAGGLPLIPGPAKRPKGGREQVSPLPPGEGSGVRAGDEGETTRPVAFQLLGRMAENGYVAD